MLPKVSDHFHLRALFIPIWSFRHTPSGEIRTHSPFPSPCLPCRSKIACGTFLTKLRPARSPYLFPPPDSERGQPTSFAPSASWSMSLSPSLSHGHRKYDLLISPPSCVTLMSRSPLFADPCDPPSFLRCILLPFALRPQRFLLLRSLVFRLKTLSLIPFFEIIVFFSHLTSPLQ